VGGGAEEARVRAVHDLEVLDTPPEDRFDRVVRLAQRLFDVPMVAVNLIDADRQWAKAGIGVDVETPRSTSFCSHAIEQGETMVISDARSDSRFRANPLVTGDPHIRFYAGHPLTAPGGQRVGALCIVDDKPRELDDAQVRLLADLAGWVERELAIDRDLLAAGELQRRLQPQRSPDLPGFEVAGRCLMAREVGGDFYDWHLVDGRLQVTLADVMGKGVAAAIMAASVRSVLRGAARFNELEQTVTRAAASLEEDLTETATFVTVFCARLDPRNGVLQYVDAGHGLSAILSPDGRSYRHLASDGLPLGAMPDDAWTAQVTLLQPGETLMSVSDGVLDCFASPQDALAAAQAWNRESGDAEQLVDRVITACGRGVPEDDVTVVVVRRSA
jgi:serine phosphatase RsbU (regulator of sigma subunit)